MKNSIYFPHRLYRWFITKQILLASTLMVLFAVVIYIWLGSRPDISFESVEVGREVLLVTLASGLITVALISLFMAKRLVGPLGRLIEKTRHMRRFPFEKESFSEDELAYDEPGEWFDLERALNKLGRDLRQKTIRLSREKTELRAIMAAVNDAVLAVNKDRRPLFFNPQFAVMFGLQGRETSQLAMGEIVRSPEVLEAYSRALKGEGPVYTETSLTLNGEKWPRTFQVSVSPLRKKHNQVIYGAVGLFHDITEMKKAEKIRIDFVANVSHELRTPLTSIKGYVQTLLHDYEKGEYDKMDGFLKIVDKNVRRLDLLVKDLLDLSSLESGAELNSEVVRTQEITELVINQLAARDHIIHMHYNVSEVKADPMRVEQVLRNLLQNAIRYVPKGEKIFVSWDKSEQGHVLLRVRDTGPGISYEHQARLFERFYRVDEARSREVGGTGIGLSIVKHIMQRHGGSVRLESEPGKGSEFICEFPHSH